MYVGMQQKSKVSQRLGAKLFSIMSLSSLFEEFRHEVISLFLRILMNVTLPQSNRCHSAYLKDASYRYTYRKTEGKHCKPFPSVHFLMDRRGKEYGLTYRFYLNWEPIDSWNVQLDLRKWKPLIDI